MKKVLATCRTFSANQLHNCFEINSYRVKSHLAACQRPIAPEPGARDAGPINQQAIGLVQL